MRKQTKKTILIIEDSADYMDLLSEWLHAYSLVKAYSLAQAIEAIGNNYISVIIMDINLPDAQKLDGIRAIHQVSKSPIIILTGEDIDLDPAMVLAAGGLSFIRKNDLRGSWALISAIEYSIKIGELIVSLDQEREKYRERSELLSKAIGSYWLRMVRDFSILYDFVKEKITGEQLQKHLDSPFGLDPQEKLETGGNAEKRGKIKTPV